jgi:hypothetical protein
MLPFNPKNIMVRLSSIKALVISLIRPLFSTLTVAQLSQQLQLSNFDAKCHSFWTSFVGNWGPFSPNGVFYRIERNTPLYQLKPLFH